MGKMEEIELTQGRRTKSLQRISRQICENSKFGSLGEGLKMPKTGKILTLIHLHFTFKRGRYKISFFSKSNVYFEQIISNAGARQTTCSHARFLTSEI